MASARDAARPGVAWAARGQTVIWLTAALTAFSACSLSGSNSEAQGCHSGAESAEAAIRQLISAAEKGDLDAACRVLSPGWQVSADDLSSLATKVSRTGAGPVAIHEIDRMARMATYAVVTETGRHIVSLNVFKATDRPKYVVHYGTPLPRLDPPETPRGETTKPGSTF